MSVYICQTRTATDVTLLKETMSNGAQIMKMMPSSSMNPWMILSSAGFFCPRYLVSYKRAAGAA